VEVELATMMEQLSGGGLLGWRRLPVKWMKLGRKKSSGYRVGFKSYS